MKSHHVLAHLAALLLATTSTLASQVEAESKTPDAAPQVAPGGGPPTGTTTYFEQNILIRSGETVEALGPTLMGDSVNEFSGGLEFTHTDVSLPGNNALPVSIGRHLATGTRQAHLATGLFGDWDLQIPHLRTVIANGFGSIPANWFGNGFGSSPNLNRCSQFQPPPSASAYAGSNMRTAPPHLWWDGYHMVAPSGADQTLMLRASGNSTQPTDGYSYPIVTKDHWQLRCLANLENGSGEGFMALAPDGTRYQFDHVATRVYPTFKTSDNGVLSRSELWILPTLITDRFGNWVRYTYGGGGWQLTSITASDGRGITLSYNGSRVQSVNDGTRTWNYAYDGNGALQTVTQPDGSRWQFAMADIERDPFSSPDPDCDYGDGPPPAPWDNYTRTGTIVHPSGATGSFGLRMTMHGRSNVPGKDDACGGPININGTVYANYVSRYFTNYSLISKTLVGPGMPSMTWSYAYSSASGSFAPCNGCVNTKTVSITDPLGNLVQNTYGTQFGINDGLLLSGTEGTPGNALRSSTYTYRPSNAGPYPSRIGDYVGMSDVMTPNSMAAIHTPQSQRVINQQGVAFTQTSSAFDTYARPTTVARSSTLGYSRSEVTAFADYTAPWVLGQTASLTIAGVQASSTSYDPTTALPTSSTKFGKFQGSYLFNADGTLASITDPLNHTTAFSNYMRGLPQHIQYADGKSIDGAVNNLGLITSVTNEAAITWNYTYDAIGRLASKIPPTGDPVAYNPTNLSFVQVPYAELGIDANHWRQTITTGNAVTVNYFDARWRKLLTTTYDAASPSTTQRMQRFTYDAYNRTTFAAYPQRSIASIGASTPGSTTTYDALGRPTQTVADSELGALTTITAYLPNFQKRVTNPRGFNTTTAYQVFDEPSESAITNIWAPETVSVSIPRDILGKPTSITRSGTYVGNAVSATRSYVYDGNQLLCKTIEPEIGATIQQLDAANNVSWRATGLNLTSTSSCDQGNVAGASKVAYAYDARNRLTGTGFGDGSPSIGRSYTPDGLPLTVLSNGSTWNYSYNKRRLLTNEALSFPNGNDMWGVARQFDANAHESQITYPDGTVVTSAPNALGEATQAGGFVSNVSYHPNGAVAGYTLGNGVVHSMTQNLRGLPEANTDAGVMSDRYAYDANANITSITDQQEGISNRSMDYDGLDRLTVANAPNVWGSGSYGYDALDNIRTSVVGSRNSTHNYDGNNRLASITSNGVITGYSYDSQGNVTYRGGQGFTFDQGNRMQQAAGKAIYSYDGLGRRVMTRGADSSITWHMYSQDGRMLASQRAWNGTYNYTLQVYLAGKSIAEYSNVSGTAYTHTDGLCSPVAQTSPSGTVISRTRYEAYGNTAAGTNPTRLGFTGHVNDADTGLVYMQQRYYDPIAGRFQSMDPVSTDPENGVAFDRYMYANNSPYKFKDPDGREGVAFTFGGELTTLLGKSAGAGGYFATDTGRSGLLTYTGDTYGLSSGLNVSYTFFLGSGTSLLEGKSTSFNVTSNIVTVGVTFSDSTKKGIFGITAFTIGAGPGLPVGGSVSTTNTVIQTSEQYKDLTISKPVTSRQMGPESQTSKGSTFTPATPVPATPMPSNKTNLFDGAKTFGRLT